jgi:hypothetical protein
MSDRETTIHKVHGWDFHDAITAFRHADRRAHDSLNAFEIDAYMRMATYLTEDGKSGFAVRLGGEIANLFSRTHHGDEMVEAAIRHGGTHLDCFDGYLVKFYSKHGFVEVKREPNWTPGEPDVVWMELPSAHKDDASEWWKGYYAGKQSACW